MTIKITIRESIHKKHNKPESYIHEETILEKLKNQEIIPKLYNFNRNGVTNNFKQQTESIKWTIKHKIKSGNNTGEITYKLDPYYDDDILYHLITFQFAVGGNSEGTKQSGVSNDSIKDPSGE